MRWLPVGPADPPAARLPISDRSALALELALLAPSPDAQRDRLTSLLKQDPALSYWAWSLASVECHEAIKTCSQAAAWLVDHLLRHLEGHWDNVGDPAPDDAVASRLAEQTTAAIALATLARQTAIEQGNGDPDEAYFAAFLDAGGRLTPSLDPAESELPVAAKINRLPSDDDVWRRLPLLILKLRRLERLEQDFEEQLEYEKIEAMKDLAYGAGHEVNNPLANISARAQTLIKDETDPQRRRKLSAINAQAYRAHEMIADLMLFARPPKLHRESVNIDELISQVIDSLRPTVKDRAITIDYQRTTPSPTAWADRVQLGVVLDAICKNAIEVLGIGGHIELSSREIQGGAVEIAIRDDGPGIAPEVRRHLFNPFYSGREAGRGLGFGLSKSWRIIREHGGQIDVHSRPGRGATFTIRIPQAPIDMSARST